MMVSWTSCHGWGLAGGWKRVLAVLSPYGMPLKTLTPLSIKPRTLPEVVVAMGAVGWPQAVRFAAAARVESCSILRRVSFMQ